MRWIKASERLPDKIEGFVVSLNLKISGKPNYGYYDNSKKLFITTDGEFNIPNVEWLSESVDEKQDELWEEAKTILSLDYSKNNVDELLQDQFTIHRK